MRRKSHSQFPILGVSILSILLMVLSACGPQGTPQTPSTTTQQAVHGGTWVDDIVAGPGSLLPNGSDTTYSVAIDQALYTPMFYGDSKGNLHPGLTSEYPTLKNGDISADLKTWTFKLRSGLKWSDGQPLNADDVDFTWKLYNNPKFGAKFTSGFDAIESTTISADKLSITFHLSRPFVAFATTWADADPGSPLPVHKFKDVDPATILKSAESQLPTVVSGPFTIKTDETTAQQQYTMVPNPNFYLHDQGMPYLDKLVFRIVNNADTILKDVQAGQITSNWFLDISQVDSFKKAAGYTVIPDAVSAGYEAIWMNQNNPALKDVAVRKAISMAIDRQKLIDTSRNGYANPLCTDHPASLVPGYQKDVVCPKFDAEGAKKVLDDAGWKLGADGVRAKGDLKLDFQYATTTLGWRKADQAIVKQELQAIGIKTTLQNYPGSTFFGTVLPQGKPGTYDIGEYEQTYSYDADDASTLDCADIPTAANSFGGQNYSFACSKEADALFKVEQSSGDPAVRQDAFNKLHKIYLTEFPFITEYAPVDVSVVKSTAHNYAPGPMGAQETVNVWTWWCEGGKC